MYLKRKLILALALVLLLALAIHSDSASPLPAFKPESIALHEAEILIYIMPPAQEVRKQGWDIGWELQTSPDLNQEDYFVFWVVNSKRPNVNGSVTIGYYSVNKHTADIWDDNFGSFVKGTELEGVQAILRRAHHIDGATTEQYRSRRPSR
jgi:hypothetical protein